MFVTRKKHEALQDEYQRVLEERDDARKQAGANAEAARTAAREKNDADTAVLRLHGRIRELQRRLEDGAVGSDAVYVLQLEQRIARLCRGAARYRAAEAEAGDRLIEEMLRSAGLQARLDDAKARCQVLVSRASMSLLHKARADELAKRLEELQAANISLSGGFSARSEQLLARYDELEAQGRERDREAAGLRGKLAGMVARVEASQDGAQR